MNNIEFILTCVGQLVEILFTIIFEFQLNLAPQAVLEGLNGIFDHRSEVFVPELCRKFQVDHVRTKIFACQNPQHEGGGRKGLPKSFLNRFTQVHVSDLQVEDLKLILRELRIPDIPEVVLDKMMNFHQKVCDEILRSRKWGFHGHPWEFNLRDLQRWCQLIVSSDKDDSDVVNRYLHSACENINLIYVERMRTEEDRNNMLQLAKEVFEVKHIFTPANSYEVTEQNVHIGKAVIPRKNCLLTSLDTLRFDDVITTNMIRPMECIATTLNQKWPCLVTCQDSKLRRSVISSLATLSGNKLSTLSTNSSMDAVELLGGFEQSDCRKKICRNLHELCNAILLDSRHNLQVVEDLRRYEKNFDCDVIHDKIVVNKLINDVAFSLSHDLKLDLEDNKRLQDLVNDLKILLRVWEQNEAQYGSFEWNDSVLVEALSNGHWLLIDEANLCSASVLDRMNSLLEENGTLFITERGVIDGSIVSIKAHENFRLIIAMSPSSGELSRAMRNRCVEINIPVVIGDENTAEKIDDEDMECDHEENVENVKLSLVQQATIRDHITAPRLAHVFKTLQIFNYVDQENLVANLRVAVETTTPNNVEYVRSVMNQVMTSMCVGCGRDDKVAVKGLLSAFNKTLNTIFNDVINGGEIVS